MAKKMVATTAQKRASSQAVMRVSWKVDNSVAQTELQMAVQKVQMTGPKLAAERVHLMAAQMVDKMASTLVVE